MIHRHPLAILGSPMPDPLNKHQLGSNCVVSEGPFGADDHQSSYTQLHEALMLQEERLDQYEALEEVRFRTVDATPEQAFLAGGDVRIGDFILLVDSDTRVPKHCIAPTVTELLLSPEVAFTQHFTTPLQASAACCYIRVVQGMMRGLLLPTHHALHPVYVVDLGLAHLPAFACIQYQF